MQPAETKFGQTIRRARQRLNASQQDVADAVGSSKAWISEMETGTKKTPSVEIVVGIARYLNLDPIRLLRLVREDFATWAKVFGWTAPKRNGAAK